MTSPRPWRTALSAAALLTLAACGGGSGTDEPVAATGTLRVALTDAPACGFDHVYVTVERVRVHASDSADERSSGWRELALPAPRKIDLLTLTNGALEELGSTPLPAGSYTQLRLILSPNSGSTLANSVVPAGGRETALFTPSAVQSGIKVIRPFTVPAGQVADLVLDFDACRSIVRRGNGSFGLKPVLTAQLRNVGSIGGVVDPAITGARVSVQKNGEVLRATVPVAATGAFAVPFLDPARAPYDVVITAPGRASAVVTGVPAATGTATVLSTATAPITLPTAVAPASRSASGTLGPAAARESAEVRALQAVGSVPAVEIAHDNVDAMTGAWQLALPTDAPRLANFSTTLPLSFAAQPGAAGKYTLQARAPGYVAQTVAADVAVANVTRDFTLVVAP